MRLLVLALATAYGPLTLAAADAPAACEDGFKSLFNGKDLSGWQGALKGYAVEDGAIVCLKKGGGNLLTEKQFSDFVLRLEYRLDAGGNNGIGIRTPAKGNPAYLGMEIQVLDDTAEVYKNLKPEQYNGSIYGAAAAKRGHMKPVGQWNAIEIKAVGTQITITLNGTVIVDADTAKLGSPEIHKQKLVGLTSRKGHIGFLGHGHRVEFRNVRIKEL